MHYVALFSSKIIVFRQRKLQLRRLRSGVFDDYDDDDDDDLAERGFLIRLHLTATT